MTLSRDDQMEQENQQFQALIREAQLKGSPNGDQRCDTCKYFVGEYKDLAYCDHPKLEILVGDDWWCQWWEQQSESSGS
jgi:hypothetical protein